MFFEIIVCSLTAGVVGVVFWLIDFATTSPEQAEMDAIRSLLVNMRASRQNRFLNDLKKVDGDFNKQLSLGIVYNEASDEELEGAVAKIIEDK